MTQNTQVTTGHAFIKALKTQAKMDAKIKADLARVEEEKKFRAGLPARLMDAQALARSLGVSTQVYLEEDRTHINFSFDNGIVEKFDYGSEPWSIDSLEATLATMKSEIEAKEARYLIAKAVFSKLTDAEKTALKEHIRSL